MENKMRRIDRAMSDEETLKLVKEGEFAVLSLVDVNGLPYAVPLDYIYHENALYFHGAQEGRKIDAMKLNQRACAVILGETTVVPEKFSRKYTSVIIQGVMEIIDDSETKRRVMNELVQQYSPDFKEKGNLMIEKSFHETAIFKLKIESISGKHGI